MENSDNQDEIEQQTDDSALIDSAEVDSHQNVDAAADNATEFASENCDSVVLDEKHTGELEANDEKQETSGNCASNDEEIETVNEEYSVEEVVITSTTKAEEINRDDDGENRDDQESTDLVFDGTRAATEKLECDDEDSASVSTQKYQEDQRSCSSMVIREVQEEDCVSEHEVHKELSESTSGNCQESEPSECVHEEPSTDHGDCATIGEPIEPTHENEQPQVSDQSESKSAEQTDGAAECQTLVTDRSEPEPETIIDSTITTKEVETNQENVTTEDLKVSESDALLVDIEAQSTDLIGARHEDSSAVIVEDNECNSGADQADTHAAHLTQQEEVLLIEIIEPPKDPCADPLPSKPDVVTIVETLIDCTTVATDSSIHDHDGDVVQAPTLAEVTEDCVETVSDSKPANEEVQLPEVDQTASAEIERMPSIVLRKSGDLLLQSTLESVSETCAEHGGSPVAPEAPEVAANGEHLESVSSAALHPNTPTMLSFTTADVAERQRQEQTDGASDASSQVFDDEQCVVVNDDQIARNLHLEKWLAQTDGQTLSGSTPDLPKAPLPLPEAEIETNHAENGGTSAAEAEKKKPSEVAMAAEASAAKPVAGKSNPNKSRLSVSSIKSEVINGVKKTTASVSSSVSKKPPTGAAGHSHGTDSTAHASARPPLKKMPSVTSTAKGAGVSAAVGKMGSIGNKMPSSMTSSTSSVKASNPNLAQSARTSESTSRGSVSKESKAPAAAGASKLASAEKKSTATGVASNDQKRGSVTQTAAKPTAAASNAKPPAAKTPASTKPVVGKPTPTSNGQTLTKTSVPAAKPQKIQ